MVYLIFLVVMGLPIMAMEVSVGRASRQSIATSFHALEPKGSKWHFYSWFGMAGNYLLMMFYTTVVGWMLLYFVKMAKGDFTNLNSAGMSAAFKHLTANEPGLMLLAMGIVVLLCMGVCALGLQNGVEKITKVMMVLMLAILLLLAVRSVTLSGAGDGLTFYLMPNFHNLAYDAMGNFILGEAIFAAMGQAFFTLSLGIGAMSTVIAVFQNIITFPKDKWGWSHKKSVLVNLVFIFILSLPCLLGYNLWRSFQPVGGNILGLEDFILSDNLLPVGSLVYLLFCVTKGGWGWDSFLREVNTGTGLRFPKGIKFYVKWMLPLIVVFLFFMGYWNRFFSS